MAGKKNLGMGLDLLLTSIDEKSLSNDFIKKQTDLLTMALDKDDSGDFLEAYHLYRLLIENLNEPQYASTTELALLISQALNNAAVILFEHGQPSRACEYLHQAIKLDPQNQTARDNLNAIKNNE